MGQQRKNSKLLSSVGNRLREIRKERSLSQEVVHNDTEIHIARIETGKQNITVSTLSFLCNYYAITLHEFFTEEMK
jgi:transcriptional regulator with XRE-family HTH domain